MDCVRDSSGLMCQTHNSFFSSRSTICEVARDLEEQTIQSEKVEENAVHDQ